MNVIQSTFLGRIVQFDIVDAIKGILIMKLYGLGGRFFDFTKKKETIFSAAMTHSAVKCAVTPNISSSFPIPFYINCIAAKLLPSPHPTIHKHFYYCYFTAEDS